MNEAAAPSPLGTTFFDSMLGLAVRRRCAPVLGLEAHASSEDYLERRQGLGAEASRSLVAAAGIKTFLVDTAIGADRLCSAAELAAMSGGTAYEVVRLIDAGHVPCFESAFAALVEAACDQSLGRDAA